EDFDDQLSVGRDRAVGDTSIPPRKHLRDFVLAEEEAARRGRRGGHVDPRRSSERGGRIALEYADAGRANDYWTCSGGVSGVSLASRSRDWADLRIASSASVVSDSRTNPAPSTDFPSGSLLENTRSSPGCPSSETPSNW